MFLTLWPFLVAEGTRALPRAESPPSEEGPSKGRGQGPRVPHHPEEGPAQQPAGSQPPVDLSPSALKFPSNSPAGITPQTRHKFYRNVALLPPKGVNCDQRVLNLWSVFEFFFSRKPDLFCFVLCFSFSHVFIFLFSFNDSRNQNMIIRLERSPLLPQVTNLCTGGWTPPLWWGGPGPCVRDFALQVCSPSQRCP